jgi:hypothetical protein
VICERYGIRDTRNFRDVFRRTVFTLVLTTLAACSTLNEGQIDYRRAASDGALQDKYAKPDNDAVIHKCESISVHLQQVFIKDFSEATDRFLNKITFNQVKVRGEIAIIAKVFELGTGQTPDFTLAATKSGGRLIYYSGDVRPGGHFLNFSALPVYGPISYGGRPLVIQLTVIEMDNAEAAQIKSLLKTLAGLGAAAYPPASPVLAVLDRVGEQLLKGDVDDTDFRYSFVLHPYAGDADPRYPILAVGDYALVKESTDMGCPGFCDTEWGPMRFDGGQGRLIRTEPKQNTTPLFKDRTYLIVQINKGFEAGPLDVAQAFAEFERNLLANTAAGTIAPEPLVSAFQVAVQRSVTFSRANRDVSRAASLRKDDPDQARESLRDALNLLKRDLERRPTEDRILSEEQIQAVVRRLRLLPGTTVEGKSLTLDQIKKQETEDLLKTLGLAPQGVQSPHSQPSPTPSSPSPSPSSPQPGTPQVQPKQPAEPRRLEVGQRPC